MSDADVAAALRLALDRLPVRPIVEYLAARLNVDDGEQRLTFRLTNGHLREAEQNRLRIRNQELEFLGSPASSRGELPLGRFDQRSASLPAGSSPAK